MERESGGTTALKLREFAIATEDGLVSHVSIFCARTSPGETHAFEPNFTAPLLIDGVGIALKSK